MVLTLKQVTYFMTQLLGWWLYSEGRNKLTPSSSVTNLIWVCLSGMWTPFTCCQPSHDLTLENPQLFSVSTGQSKSLDPRRVTREEPRFPEYHHCRHRRRHHHCHCYWKTPCTCVSFSVDSRSSCLLLIELIISSCLPWDQGSNPRMLGKHPPSP